MDGEEINPNIFSQNPVIFKLQEEIISLKTQLKEERGKIKYLDIKAPYLTPHKTFGLTVCGDVHLNKMEVRIVNTEEFQRLRKVKQLGTTYMVYPSAVHTRFEHSLGVLAKADLIIKKIRENGHSEPEEKYISSEEEQIIRLMALLHDIGHMPFGHTIEDEFGIFKSHDKHDARWEHFLGEGSTIGKIIIEEHKERPDLYKRFFRLIKCEKKFTGFENDAFMYDIISNTVCADLLDYLERDCFYTNLKIKYHPRFLDYFFIKNNYIDKKIKKYIPEKRIAIRIYKKGEKEIRHDVVSELIQLLKYRYFLGERVYYHHAKIITSTILSGSVLRAKHGNSFKAVNLDAIKADPKNPIYKRTEDIPLDKIIFNIHEMGDDELILFLKGLSSKKQNKEKDSKSDELKKETLKDSASRLADLYDRRILFKQIEFYRKGKLGIDQKHIERIEEYEKEENEVSFRESIEEEIGGTSAFRIFNSLLREGASSERLDIEDTICSYLTDMQPGDVLLYCPPFKMAMKLAKMKVAYLLETSVNEIEDVVELLEFETTADRTTIKECKHIAKKHEELWAFRIFANPKFVNPKHPLYSKKYEKYKSFIIGYVEWCLANRNLDEKTSKGRHFWNDFIRDRKYKVLSQNDVGLLSDEAIENITKTMMDHTNSDKSIEFIDKAIIENAKRL